jgi:hypothetical protein
LVKSTSSSFLCLNAPENRSKDEIPQDIQHLLSGQLISGRVLISVCVGITSSQVPVYLAEIAKRTSVVKLL